MNKNTLTVKTVSAKHSGKWTCELKYNGGFTLKAMTDVTIVDLAPSTSDPIYTHDSAYNLNIPCSFSSKMTWSTLNKVGVTEGSWSFSPLNRSESPRTLLDLNLTPSAAWKSHDGTQSLLMESEVKDTVLDVKISKVSVNNRGTYTCNLKFGSQTISRNVQVEVLQVISSAGKVIYAGYPLNLTCTLGHPMSSDLEVNWITPHSSSRQNLNNPYPMQLSIPAVGLKDRGRWICELKKNSTVLTSATFTLKVENAPVNIWMIIAIVVGVLVLILIIVITVIYVRRCREETLPHIVEAVRIIYQVNCSDILERMSPSKVDDETRMFKSAEKDTSSTEVTSESPEATIDNEAQLKVNIIDAVLESITSTSFKDQLTQRIIREIDVGLAKVISQAHENNIMATEAEQDACPPPISTTCKSPIESSNIIRQFGPDCRSGSARERTHQLYVSPLPDHFSTNLDDIVHVEEEFK
ncbi:CD4-1 molecule precursor [Silurus meridionalis]|nr:CD4-1 molecule precursor [Silurus meridionalis]